MTTMDYTRYVEPFISDPDIHDEQRLSLGKANLVSGIILALIVGIIDVVLIWLALNGTLPGWLALGVHCVLVFAIFLIFILPATRTGTDVRLSQMVVLLAFVAGPFGAFGGILMALSHLFFRSDSLSFAEWFQFIYPRPTPSLGESVYDDIVLEIDEQSKNYDVVPFVDVMRLGSPEQKCEAINQMALHFHPRYSEAFDLALKDNALSVRTLAATTVSRIERQLSSQEQKLKQVIERGDPSPELLLATARFYDDYSYSGILDADRQQRFSAEAYEFYQRYLRRRSDDEQVAVWVGRLLVRSGQLQRAAEWLKTMLDEGRGGNQVLGWYAEVLFQLGRYDEVSHFVRDHRAAFSVMMDDERYTHMANSIRLWVDDQQEAA